MIQRHFPHSPSPKIARPSHETTSYLGLKISQLLEKLGATPQDVDVNFLDLDPYVLIEEVHRGIQAIRALPVHHLSIPARLMQLAKESPESYATIWKIQEVARDVMSQCRGLVLPGGIDIETEFYQTNSDLQKIDYRRSIAEFAFVGAACNQKKPILGTCRGAQLINVYFGGTLENIDRQMDWQTVDLTASSKQKQLAQLFQDSSISAYFAHHQACAKIAPGFEVVMERGDIPEMILNEDNTMIGIQTHPEREESERYSKTMHIYQMFLKKAIFLRK